MSNELRGHLVGIMERAHGGQLPSALDIRELEQYIAERERAARIEEVENMAEWVDHDPTTHQLFLNRIKELEEPSESKKGEA